MSKTIKNLLVSTAVYSSITIGVIVGSPHILDYVLNTYHKMQLEASLQPFSRDETKASRAMMKLKKHLVVNIKTPTSSGSGNHLSKNVILTARHVAEGAVPGTVVKTSINGKVEVKQVTGVVLHPTMDIALVLIGEPDIDLAADIYTIVDNLLLNFRTPIDEEKVFRIGFSQAKAMNSSEGRYEKDETPSEEILTRDLDLFKVQGAGGDSGSIIFGADGMALGMVNEGPSGSLVDSKDVVKDSGLDKIPDDERSLVQDEIKTLTQDRLTIGYGRNLSKGVDELIFQLKALDIVVPQPQVNIMSLFQSIIQGVQPGKN